MAALIIACAALAISIANAAWAIARHRRAARRMRDYPHIPGSALTTLRGNGLNADGKVGD